MNSKTIDTTTKIFKLLSDPTRFQIVALLFERPGVCVNEIAEEVSITHSAASHQLAKLEAHDIVQCKRDGRTMCYEVTDTDTDAAKAIKKALYLFV